MNYPKCNGKHCKFREHGGMTTLMYSPIAYDRKGNPVSGGNNNVGKEVECVSCRKYYYAKQTELEWAQNVEPEWKIITRK